MPNERTPPIPDAELKRSLRDAKLADWSAGAESGMVLVGHRPLLESLDLSSGEHTLLPKADVATPDGQNKARTAPAVFVLDLDDEPAAIRKIKADLGHNRVYGLISDLVVARTLGLGPGDDSEALRCSRPPDCCFAVLCTARSGSTWFCHLLQNTGVLGHPSEHLRPPVVFLARHAARFGFSIVDWAETLIRAKAKNGVFGTKVIDNFVDDILPALSPDEKHRIEQLLSGFRFIHFERRDKVAQAVSKFMATKSHVWHLRTTDAAQAYREKKAQVEYDGSALKEIHDGLHENEERYRRFLTSTGAQALHLTYEDARADPELAIRTVAEFLLDEAPDNLPIVHERYFPMADDINAAFAERLRAEYGLAR